MYRWKEGVDCKEGVGVKKRGNEMEGRGRIGRTGVEGKEESEGWEKKERKRGKGFELKKRWRGEGKGKGQGKR